MVIIDEPYVSDMLLEWLEASKHPVLGNAFAKDIVKRCGIGLNLVGETEAAKRISEGERVYTNSENALSWIVANVANEDLEKGIGIFKDKLRMRRELASIDPDYYFQEVTGDDLKSISFDGLPDRFVLKPAVGFCSMGVYVIETQDEWDRALEDIEEQNARWNEMYPTSVVDAGTFMIEEYIDGQEYAIDAFFDEQGRACVLNIMKHDFASADDTSDRMYTSGASVYLNKAPEFGDWLDRVNGKLQIKNFPFHVEVREKNGRILPIEFNPLRFAGLGGTDVSQYAFGFKTYEAFLENDVPPIDAYREQDPDALVTMALLNPPSGITGDEAFDYDGFAQNFSDVCALTQFDVNKVGNYGFLFARVSSAESPELAFLMNDDLRDYLH